MGRPFIDETGKRYGKLQVLNLSRIDSRGVAWFLCKCDCGKEIEIRGQCLRDGNNIACGCSQGLKNGLVNPHFVNKTGKRFGKFTVIKFNAMIKGQSTWLCRCDCGTEKIMRGRTLTSGKNGTKSCGCLVKLAKGESCFNSLYWSYTKSAKDRKLKWGINKEEFRKITEQNCYYCGSPPSNVYKTKKANGGYTYTGLDRIDSDKGYFLSNIVPCCGMCNWMKRDTPKEEFRNRICTIYEHWAKKF